MQIIAGPTGQQIAQEVANQLGCNVIIPEYKIFPDGEGYIRISNVKDEPTLIIQSCDSPQDTNLFHLLNLVRTIRKQVTKEITCYVPYLCYTRADREVLPGEAISVETVLHLIKSVGVDHLIVLDIHNPAVLLLTKMRTTNILPTVSIRKYLEEKSILENEMMIIAPDEGALYRAEALATELNMRFGSLQKTRDPKTGNVNLSLGDLKDFPATVLLVDDIISTGGTLVEASNLLKIQGVSKLHYIITHALGTVAVDRLLEIGNGIVVATNSTSTLISIISSSHDLVKVLNK
ncbi:MAG: ribose-phosphate diphosphokinase [Candidatus Kariarchaeaceae archaeon]|jgi:ribose-phosphate pyrophosphokinase